MKHDCEQGCEDTSTDGAADTFQPPAESTRDMGLQHDERCKQKPITVIDVQQKNQGHIQPAYNCHTQRMPQCQRTECEVGGEEIEVWAQLCLFEPLKDVFRMRRRDRGSSGGFGRFPKSQEGCAFDRRLQDKGRFCYLRKQEAITGIGGGEAAREIVRKAIHLAPLGSRVGDCQLATAGK